MSEDRSEARDRRRNVELRERIDELIELARKLSRRGSLMTERELRETEERIEWLAEEVWRAALDPLRVRREDPGSGAAGGADEETEE